MVAPRLLPFAVALALSTQAFASIPQQKMTAQEFREYKAVSYFLRAVDNYVLVHRIVEPVQPEALCLPEGTIDTIDNLAATPLDARPAPREGDIFALDVADLFRDRIAKTLRHHEINTWDLVSEMNEEEMFASLVAVGEPLPVGVGKRPTEWLASALPLLPEKLEYRIVGRDLVLFDAEANLVVDVLRVALPMY